MKNSFSYSAHFSAGRLFHYLIEFITHPVFLPVYWLVIEGLCRPWFTGDRYRQLYFHYGGLALVGLVVLPLALVGLARLFRLTHVWHPTRSERRFLLAIILVTYTSYFVMNLLRWQDGETFLWVLLAGFHLFVLGLLVLALVMLLLYWLPGLQPSLHVAGWTFMTTWFGLYAFVHRQWHCQIYVLPALILLTGFVAAHRLYLQRHPTRDVVVALICGLGCAWLLWQGLTHWIRQSGTLFHSFLLT